jgi:hypothetical protein
LNRAVARLATPGPRHIGVALAVVVFLWSWAFLSHSFYAGRGNSDAVYYQPYGLQTRDGELPYRDFAVEYPPGALVVFVAPTFVGHPEDLANYETWFARLMCALGLCTLLLVARAHAPAWGLALVAVSPLLIGTLAPERFDLWPTALTAAGVVALLGDRHRLGWAALAAAFAAKLYPAVLLPPAAIWTFRRRGPTELARCLAVGLAVAAVAFVPFLLLAPHGLWTSLWGQASRATQIESLVASYLMTIGHPRTNASYTTVGIVGHRTISALSSAAQLAALVWIWIAFGRGEATRDRFIRYAAASVCAFVAFGTVFSPQFLIWLVPLVALVRGYRGMIATGMLVVSFILTNMWYGSGRFVAYVNTGQYAWLLLTRNLIIVLLLAVLVSPGQWARHPRRRSPRQLPAGPESLPGRPAETASDLP